EESTLELSESILNTPMHKRGLVWLPHAYAWHYPRLCVAWCDSINAYAWNPCKINSSSRESTLKVWSRFSEAKKKGLPLSNSRIDSIGLRVDS
ncbi:hypothetical protein PIB30_111943, partial [Stylosanthes scabra]|nr:hypothetical protein [Stylosanthes scabra]